MLAGPAVGEVVDHSLHVFDGAWCVGPQIGTMRLARAGLKHCHQGLVGMQYAVSEDGAPDCVPLRLTFPLLSDQGLQAYAACAEAFARLVGLLDAPGDIAVLAPLLEAELYYRLLQSPIGLQTWQLRLMRSQFFEATAGSCSKFRGVETL
jgi:hypothetical protein